MQHERSTQLVLFGSASRKTPPRFLESRRTLRGSLPAPSTSQAGEVETAGRGFDEAALEQQHCCRRTRLICSSSAKTTKRNSLSLCEEILLQRELEEVRSAELGRGHAHAHQGRTRMSRHSLGQTRTHVLVGREEDARRLRQSRAAMESAGQSCLTAPRRENCELTAQLGLRSTQAMDRAQTAHLRSRRRRANTHREKPCASPTVRGGRHRRATCHVPLRI